MTPIGAIEIQGGTNYFVSQDRVQIQNREFCPKEAEEYDMYMDDLDGYIINILSYRENIRNLTAHETMSTRPKKALIAFRDQSGCTKAVFDEIGVVQLSGGAPIGKMP